MRRALWLIPLVLSVSAIASAQEDQPPITPPVGPTPATQPAPPPPPPPPPPRHAPPATDREEPRHPHHHRMLPAPVPASADVSPVVRAMSGNLGLFFRFGGLANLFATGNSRTVAAGTTGTEAVILTQVGMKFVLSERWMFPVYIGAAIRALDPDQGSGRTDVGLDFGGGFEHHFRVWRRISPFVGFNLGVGITEPNGEHNNTYGAVFGPSLGVEYYIGDRVSLAALYQLVFNVAYQEIQTSGSGPSTSVTGFLFQTLAGGSLYLTYYF
jgi:hypothetical protein